MLQVAMDTQRRGPKPVISQDDEAHLADYVCHMANIGYPLSRKALYAEVKKLLDKDERVTPFRDNYPGNSLIIKYFKLCPVKMS